MNPEITIDIAGIIREQKRFQSANVGIRDGVPETMFEWTGRKENMVRGLKEELAEVDAALSVEVFSRADALEETADLMIRILDVASHVCQALDATPEEFQAIVNSKVEQMVEKYAPEHFIGRTPEEGMKESKRQWNKPTLELILKGGDAI